MGITRNANILYSNKDKLNLWSLQTGNPVLSEDTEGISCIYISPMGTRFFIGYKSGKLELRLSNTFKVETSIDFESRVMAVISDDKTVYVSLADGRIVYFNVNNTDDI